METKHLFIGTIVALIIVLLCALLFTDKQDLGANVELIDPQIISWDKPTTDAEWAEDNKKENFDMRPNDVLDTMIESHTAKLAREEEAYKKFTMCPDCAYYEFYKGFKDSGYTEEDAVAEATKQATEAQQNALRSVEKLKQSVERMEKEKELRTKGYLIVVDGASEVNEELLGSVEDENRVRHVRY